MPKTPPETTLCICAIDGKYPRADIENYRLNCLPTVHQDVVNEAVKDIANIAVDVLSLEEFYEEHGRAMQVAVGFGRRERSIPSGNCQTSENPRRSCLEVIILFYSECW